MSADERIAAFEKKFDDIDTKKTGKMDKATFNTLYNELEGKEMPREESDVMFDGIDIDNSGKVTKQEFMDLVRAIVNNNELYKIKLVFRAFDKDRSSLLDLKEVISIVKYTGKEITDEQAQTFVENQTGKKNGKISFANLYKLLTDKDIDPKTDPYDGKLKSGCCLLI